MRIFLGVSKEEVKVKKVTEQNESGNSFHYTAEGINFGVFNSGFAKSIRFTDSIPVNYSKLSEKRINEIIIERALLSIEFETDPNHANIFLLGSSNNSFTENAITPESIVNIIIEAATEYIFEQYKIQHPQMAAGNFEDFKARVVRGVEKGMREAKNILIGLGANNQDIKELIFEIEKLLFIKLQRFFDEETGKYL